MTRVTFLGVGAALPFPGQTNCAFLLEGGGVTLLFDCGPTVLQQLASVGKSPGDITHLFVSHAHGDHALGWPMFLLWWALEGRPGRHSAPVVLASRTTWTHLRALWEHSYGELPAPLFQPIELPDDCHHVECVNPDVEIGTWPMVHSTKFPVLGAHFRFEKHHLAFTADSARCSAISQVARVAHLLVHDARYARTVPPERLDQSHYHCSALDAGEYAAAADHVKTLALVHIGAEYEGRHEALVAEARAKFAGQVIAPRAGDVIEM